MQEIPTYYVTLKPTRKDGKAAQGMHHIAFVDDPAIEEVGIYLNLADPRIVANETIQAEILKHLSNCGQVKPEHWREVEESEYLEAREIAMTNDPLARSSFNDLPDPKGGGQWLVRYKYTGVRDDKNREFCAAILDMDRIYTEEEIKNGLSNPEFGNYSIFDYKGSYGCRHVWKRQIYYEDYADDEVRRVGFVPRVVARLDDEDATTLNAFLSKDEKMQVCAPLLIPDKDVFRNDDKIGRYNIRFSADTIKDIREVALSSGVVNRADLFKNTHEGDIAPSYILEEWIIEDENDIAYTEYGFKASRVPVGSWMVLSQVTDKEFWKHEVKLNKKHAYSIEAIINLTNIKLAKMENPTIQIPDGEHTIGNKIYTFKDGVAVSFSEIEKPEEMAAEPVAEPVVETMETAEEVVETVTEEVVEAAEEAPAVEYVPLEKFNELVTEVAALRAIIEQPATTETEVQMSKPVKRSIWQAASQLVK